MKRQILIFMMMAIVISCSDKKYDGMTLLDKGESYTKSYKNRKEIRTPSGTRLFYKYNERVSGIRLEPGADRIPYTEREDKTLYEGGPTRETEYENFDEEQEKLVKKPRKPIVFREDVPKADYPFLKKFIMENGPYIYLGEGIGKGRYLFILLNRDYYKEDAEKLLKDERYYPARNRASRQVYLVDKNGAKSIELDLSELGIDGLPQNVVISRIKTVYGRIFAVVGREEEKKEKEFPFEYQHWLVEIRMSEGKAYPLFYNWENIDGRHLFIGGTYYYLRPGKEGELGFIYGANTYFVKVTDYYQKNK